ncbi:MAG: sporulation transcriptional regulator SpoIIID [Bacilli bacterium]
MNRNIYNRVLLEAKYIIDNNKTIRGTSNVFGVSKSTVHKDIGERLLGIDKNMYKKVSSILKYNADIKHIRGGEATKRKFLDKKAN